MLCSSGLVVLLCGVHPEQSEGLAMTKFRKTPEKTAFCTNKPLIPLNFP
jgi:hypothetical protein